MRCCILQPVIAFFFRSDHGRACRVLDSFQTAAIQASCFTPYQGDIAIEMICTLRLRSTAPSDHVVHLWIPISVNEGLWGRGRIRTPRQHRRPRALERAQKGRQAPPQERSPARRQPQQRQRCSAPRRRYDEQQQQ